MGLMFKRDSRLLYLTLQPDPRLLGLALQSHLLKLRSNKFNIIINIKNIIICIIDIIIIINKFEKIYIINIEKQPWIWFKW
jgi:hypothetical protein